MHPSRPRCHQPPRVSFREPVRYFTLNPPLADLRLLRALLLLASPPKAQTTDQPPPPLRPRHIGLPIPVEVAGSPFSCSTCVLVLPQDTSSPSARIRIATSNPTRTLPDTAGYPYRLQATQPQPKKQTWTPFRCRPAPATGEKETPTPLHRCQPLRSSHPLPSMTGRQGFSFSLHPSPATPPSHR